MSATARSGSATPPSPAASGPSGSAPTGSGRCRTPTASWSRQGRSRTSGWPPARRRGATGRSGSCSTARSRSSTRTSTSGSRAPAGSSAGRGTTTSRGWPTRRSTRSSAAQRDDGYLNTFVQVLKPGGEFRDLQFGHELYCFGHLIQAAVAWHRALGDDRLLAVARRAADTGRPRPRAGRRARHRRAPGDRARPRGPVPGHRRGALPRARAPAPRAARARDAGRRPVRVDLLAGPPPGPRGARGHGARGAPAVPRRRGRGRRGRDRRRRAPRRGPSPLARHGRDPLVPDRRRRQPARDGGVRRPVRAPARSRLHGDLRGDRERDARPAPAARDRGPGRGRRDRADDPQRRAVGRVGGRHPVLLREPAPAPHPPGRGGPGTGERKPWYACACCPPNVVRTLASWPQHLATSDDGGRAAVAVRRRGGPRARPRRRGAPARGQRVPVGRPGHRHGRCGAGRRVGARPPGAGLGRRRHGRLGR